VERQAGSPEGAAGSTATSLDSRGPPGEYSRKVPQRSRITEDLRTPVGTVTCADTRGWTGCLLMACKRSGVQIPP